MEAGLGIGSEIFCLWAEQNFSETPCLWWQQANQALNLGKQGCTLQTHADTSDMLVPLVMLSLCV